MNKFINQLRLNLCQRLCPSNYIVVEQRKLTNEILGIKNYYTKKIHLYQNAYEFKANPTYNTAAYLKKIEEKKNAIRNASNNYRSTTRYPPTEF